MVTRHTSAIDRLFEQPQRFGFFQAVRLLERWFEQQEQLPPGAALGKRLRFRNSLSLSFPASEIAHFEVVPLVLDATAAEQVHAGRTQAIQRIEITPAFMGLLGAGGTLPHYYTELFAQRETFHKDSAARSFLDIFLHRAVVLFYQAWRKHRLPLQFEADRKQRFLPLVLSLGGLGPQALRDRLRGPEGGVADDTLAFYAALLRQRPFSAVVIRNLLAQYFRVPVALESFVGRWFTLPQDNQTTLGLANAGLGEGAVMGERVWQRDLRLRLTLGPMGRDKYRRFLPGGPGELALRELLTLMTGVTLEYEVRLALRAADVQPARLDAAEGPRLGWDGFLTTRAADVQPARLDAHDGPRLGWDGFLTTRAAEADRSDAGYDIHAMA